MIDDWWLMIAFLSATYNTYESEICFEVETCNDQMTVSDLRIFYASYSLSTFVICLRRRFRSNVRYFFNDHYIFMSVICNSIFSLTYLSISLRYVKLWISYSCCYCLNWCSISWTMFMILQNVLMNRGFSNYVYTMSTSCST